MLIDRQLRAAGWAVQDREGMNLFAGPGVAVREVVMARGHGRADYLLYVEQRAAGVIEAKPEGMPLSGVEWQSARYAEGLPAEIRLKTLTRDGRLPFVFEASGSETHFTNGFDPQPRARRIFAYPQPGTLARIARDAQADPERPTWRAKVSALPPVGRGLRCCRACRRTDARRQACHPGPRQDPPKSMIHYWHDRPTRLRLGFRSQSSLSIELPSVTRSVPPFTISAPPSSHRPVTMRTGS
jgi:hypothetical protein